MTAHNLEDQVETFFIRLSRGSGLKGLAAMKSLTDLKNNIKVLRPLLGIKKELKKSQGLYMELTLKIHQIKT